MLVEIASFSDRGLALGEKLAAALADAGDEARVARFGGAEGREKQESPSAWTARVFASAGALVFIGSCGIAVRLIAPWVRTKMRDPAVVVVDEMGRHAVSLLSGHVGGANLLTERIAAWLGAEAVVTTATDLAGVFAFDSWAARKGYALRHPGGIKEVAAAMLRGGRVGLACAFPWRGALPDGVFQTENDQGVRIDFRRRGGEDDVLQIVPKFGVLGVGCRRGTERSALLDAFRYFCDEAEVAPEAVGLLASVDLKRDEMGVIELARELAVPFRTFSAAELQSVPGDFSSSPFVEAIVGVGNVCERAAMAGANETWGGGELVVLKAVYHGVALALAMGKVELSFFEA